MIARSSSRPIATADWRATVARLIATLYAIQPLRP
jgi:hypothetical protein